MTLNEFKATVADVRKKRTKRQALDVKVNSARRSEESAYDKVIRAFHDCIREEVLPEGMWSPIHSSKTDYWPLFVVRTTDKLPLFFKEYFKVAASRSYCARLPVLSKSGKGCDSVIEFSAKQDPKLKVWRYELKSTYRQDPLSYLLKQLNVKVDPKSTIVAKLERRLEKSKRASRVLQDRMKALTKNIKIARNLRGEKKPKKRARKK